MAVDTPYIPFKNFLALVSFVGSISISLAVSASLGLATTTSFMGLQDEATMTAVRHSAEIFTWAAAVHGMGLVLSLLAQLLFTSPRVVAIIVDGPHATKMRRIIGFLAWVSLGLVGAGTALVGEGLKIIDKRAGSVLQWILLGFGLPILFLWTSLRKIEVDEKSKLGY